MFSKTLKLLRKGYKKTLSILFTFIFITQPIIGALPAYAKVITATPALNITSPANNAIVSGNVSVTAELSNLTNSGEYRYWAVVTAPDSTPVYYPFTINGDKQNGTIISFVWDSTLAINGTYGIVVKANLDNGHVNDPFPQSDPDNLISSINISIQNTLVDTIAPEVPTPIYPINNILGPGTIVFDWSLISTDPGNSLPVSYIISIDDVEYTSAVDSYSVSGLAEGMHSWKVKSCDSINNCSVWSSDSSFTIDESAPSVPINGTPNGVYVNSGNVTFSWENSNDLYSPISYTLIYSRTSTFDDPVIIDSIPTNSKLVNGMDEGLWYWKVKAIDLLGYESEWSNLWSFTIDTIAPSIPTNIRFTNPALACGDYTNVGSNTVDWDDSTDTLSGISGYQYSIDYPLPAGGRGLWTTSLLNSQYSGTLNQGLHQIKVRALDNAGNYSAWTSLCDITYDNIAPHVQITSPIAEYISGNVPIRGTVTDANPHHYWLVIQNGSGTTIAGPGTVNDSTSFTDKLFFNWNTHLVADGSYTVKLEARDSANNKSSDSVHWKTVKVDNSAPVTTDNSDSMWHKPTLNISLVCNDGLGSGCANTYYSIDGGGYVSGNSVLIPSSGPHTVSYYSVDALGNTESTKTITVYVDGSMPSVTSVKASLDFNPFVNGDMVLVSANVSDTFSGLSTGTCQITKDGGITWDNGIYTSGKCMRTYSSLPDGFIANFGARIFDKVGNEGIGLMASRIVDSYNPTVDVDIDNTYYGPNTFSSSTIKGTSSDTVSDTNVKIFLRRSTDSRFYNGSSFCAILCFLPITLNVNGDTSWNYSGISNSKFTNGVTYSVTPMVFDSVGHTAVGSTDSFIWDNVKPTTSSNTDNNWHNTSINVVLTCSDSLSGCYETRFSVNGDTFQVGNSFTVSTEGNNEIRFYSTDNAGNIESIKYAYAKIDTINPEVEITNPENNSWVNGTVNINGYAQDINLEKYNVSTFKAGDDTSDPSKIIEQSTVYTTSTSNPTTLFLMNTTNGLYPDGLYQVKLVANDLAGNSSTDYIITLNVDNTAPETSDDTDGLWHTSDVTINLTCTDGDGIGCSQIYYTTDGTTPTTSSSTTLPIVLTDDGYYVIQYFAVDLLGNIETVKYASNRVKIDKTDPKNPLITTDPLVDTHTNTNNITASWEANESEATLAFISSSASDNLSGVDGYSYEFSQLPDSNPDEIKDLEEDSTSVNSGGLIDGTWYFHIKTVDTAGNWSDPVTAGPIYLDTQNPVISLIGTTPVNLVQGSTYTDAGATALDNIDGDITANIVTTSTVNTNFVGTYTVTYNVSDTAGNSATPVVRTVVVNAPVIIPEVQGATDVNKPNKEKDNEGEVLGLTCDVKQTISGYVYEDKNGNDVKDENEKGFDNISIKIYYNNEKGEKVLLTEVKTDENGYWSISACPQTYSVELVTESVDSKYSVSGDSTKIVILSNGTDLSNVSFELEKEGSNLTWLWILLILLAIVVVTGTGYYIVRRKKND